MREGYEKGIRVVVIGWHFWHLWKMGRTRRREYKEEISAASDRESAQNYWNYRISGASAERINAMIVTTMPQMKKT
jgi:hypothetical protein